jgi:hypothetical protein
MYYCKPFADMESANMHLFSMRAKYPNVTFNLSVSSDNQIDTNLENWYNAYNK